LRAPLCYMVSAGQGYTNFVVLSRRANTNCQLKFHLIVSCHYGVCLLSLIQQVLFRTLEKQRSWTFTFGMHCITNICMVFGAVSLLCYWILVSLLILFNAAKFGWRPLLECRAVMLPRRETSWNSLGCPKQPNGSQSLVGRSSPYCEDLWGRYCCLTGFFFRLSTFVLVAKI